MYYVRFPGVELRKEIMQFWEILQGINDHLPVVTPVERISAFNSKAQEGVSPLSTWSLLQLHSRSVVW